MQCPACGYEAGANKSCLHCGHHLLDASGTAEPTPQQEWRDSPPVQQMSPPMPALPHAELPADGVPSASPSHGYVGTPSQPLWGYAPPSQPLAGYPPAPPYAPYAPYPGAPMYAGGYAPPSMPLYPDGSSAPGAPAYGPYAPPSMPLAPENTMPPGTPGYPPYPPYPPYPSYIGSQMPSMPLLYPQNGGQPPLEPPRHKRASWVTAIALTGIALVLLAVGGIGFVVYQEGASTPRSFTTNTAPTNSSPTLSPTTAPAATATPPPSNIVFQDSLQGANQGWASDSNCAPNSDGYHVKGSYICYAPATIPADAVYTVTVKALSGGSDYSYGMAFRRSGQGNYDFFGVDIRGDWTAGKAQGDKYTALADYTVNAAIHTGTNTVNTLQVRVTGSHFVFLVNGTQVGAVDDGTYTQGGFGLAGAPSSEVVFTNLEIDRASGQS